MAINTGHFGLGHFGSGTFPPGHWPLPPIFAVSLQQAKEHVRLYTDEDDFLIRDLILAAQCHAELFQRRLFITRAATMYLDGFPTEIRPIFSPLVSVETIKYIDEDGVMQLLGPANYRVDTDTEPGRITIAYDCNWPETRNVTNAVVIEYTAGYGEADDVPGDIKSALLLLVGHLYENRSAVEQEKIKIPRGVLSLLWKRKLCEV